MHATLKDARYLPVAVDPEMCVDDVNLSLGFVHYTLASIGGNPRLKLSVLVP